MGSSLDARYTNRQTVGSGVSMGVGKKAPDGLSRKLEGVLRQLPNFFKSCTEVVPMPLPAILQ